MITNGVENYLCELYVPVAAYRPYVRGVIGERVSSVGAPTSSGAPICQGTPAAGITGNLGPGKAPGYLSFLDTGSAEKLRRSVSSNQLLSPAHVLANFKKHELLLNFKNTLISTKRMYLVK